MGDLVGAAGLGVGAEELQVSRLGGHGDDVSLAFRYANVIVAGRPDEFEFIIIDLLIAERNGTSVHPLLAAGDVCAGDERGAIEDAILSAFGLTVFTADMIGSPTGCLNGNAGSDINHLPSLY